MSSNRTPPQREIRAAFDDTSLIVYQAYSAQIADAAVAAGTFVPPFSLWRMTWIKPSFLWMMYRSGWATKPGQECVLAIRITRQGLEEALADACLSHYSPDAYDSHDDWLRRKESTAVRVQWDPERSPRLGALPWRSIQIGLGGWSARQYVSEWITEISDITATVREIEQQKNSGDETLLRQRLSAENPYPLPTELARVIAADSYLRPEQP